jgi:selenocysteine lyase/cysteine desulfurase
LNNSLFIYCYSFNLFKLFYYIITIVRLFIRSPVNYSPGNPLAGSTPSFISSVILFNEVMNLWDIHGIDIYYVHKHVMKLHKLFFEGLKAQRALNRGSKYINMEKLVKSTRLLGEPQVEDESIRSHTLVFEQADAATAAAAITALADHGIACDSRKQFVRLGFGLKHSPEDIDRLVKALEYSGYNAFY